MIQFLVKRFIGLLFVLLGVTFITFTLGHFAPGDPIALMLGQHFDPVLYARLRHQYGLDQPFFKQYYDFIVHLAQLNFGYSYKYQSRAVWDILKDGVPTSVELGLWALFVQVILGVPLGIVSALKANTWIDTANQAVMLTIFAIPVFIFAIILQVVILLTGILGGWADDTLSKIPIVGPNGNARLLLVSFALAFVGWALMARYVRGQTLQLKEQQFIEAARTSGTSNLRIILCHILPNLFSIVVVAATLDIANTIVGEAGLSYLGLGVQPPGSSIGLMISDAATFVESNPWEVLVPSVVLAIIVLSFSFMGDGLRDAFDPRSKD